MTDPLERWPGYNEQSWCERFHELDRRHTTLEALFRYATSDMARLIARDSGSNRRGENSRSEVEGEALQSGDGGTGASPDIDSPSPSAERG